MLLNKRDFAVEVHVLWNEYVAKKLDVSISPSGVNCACGNRPPRGYKIRLEE